MICNAKNIRELGFLTFLVTLILDLGKSKLWKQFERKPQVEINKSSHLRCSIKKAVLKNFAIFVEKHLFWSLVILLKRDSSTGVFP